MENSVDYYIKKAQQNLNKRIFEQFVMPIIRAYEQKNTSFFNLDVKRKIELLKTNLADSLQNRVEVLNGKEYISYTSLLEEIEREINNILV